jgi:hypothetical protein
VVVLGVSYGCKFGIHVFPILGLGRGYVFITAPSDPLIILSPHDGKSDIQHCCNNNRETMKFVVKETVSVLLCAP